MPTTLQIQAQDLIEVLKSQRNDAEDQYASCLAMNRQLMRANTTMEAAIGDLTKHLEETRQALVTANTALTEAGKEAVSAPDAFPPNDPTDPHPPQYEQADTTE